eukprot:Pgem_evm1s4021
MYVHFAWFPFGECTQYNQDCHVHDGYSKGFKCEENSNFNLCFNTPGCGWCQENNRTENGTCVYGDGNNPQDINDCAVGNYFSLESPDCQCNGKGNCSLNGSCMCDVAFGLNCEFCPSDQFGKPHSPCADCNNTCMVCNSFSGDCKQCVSNITYGPTCELCLIEGTFYNNTECESCFCNGQTENCDNITGYCYCPPGVSGNHCEECIPGSLYTGNPSEGGNCYYNLNANQIVRFLLKNEIRYVRVKPITLNTDLNITFSVPVNLGNATALFTLYSQNNIDGSTNTIVENYTEEFSRIFSHNDWDFANTVFDLAMHLEGSPPTEHSPFAIVFYVQYLPEQSLIKFFVIFFVCFFCLLLLVGISWKVYLINQRRRFLEMREAELKTMASRPFASAVIDSSCESYSAVGFEYLINDEKAIKTILIELPNSNDINLLVFGSTICSLLESKKSRKKRKSVFSRLSK